jgi:hypothetical protein
MHVLVDGTLHTESDTGSTSSHVSRQVTAEYIHASCYIYMYHVKVDPGEIATEGTRSNHMQPEQAAASTNSEACRSVP